MKVDGVMGSVEFDGEWITITKRAAGSQPVIHRLTVRDISGTTCKPGTRLFHGYVQFLTPGAVAAGEARGLAGGRPPHSDRNSLSIRRRNNDAAAKLVAAVEEARRRLSP